MIEYNKEQHAKLRNAKYEAYKTGDVTCYREAALTECYDYVLESKQKFYDIFLDINLHIDEANFYYECCLESDKKNYGPKDFAVVIATEVFDFLLPIITAVNPTFTDTGNRMFPDFKWIEVAARFRALSNNLKSAKQLEDISYYIFSLSPVADVEFIFLEFKRFCSQFSQYLDDLAAWIDEALTKKENIWIMGL